MQSTPGDPNLHAHPRLLGRLRGSRIRRLCRRITGYVRRASGSYQSRACVCHQRRGPYPQRECFTYTITPTWMNGLQRFCREGVAWKHLRHPNILPLLGVTLNEHRFALVSEWMENGNINEFIKRDRHINRTELVRCYSVSW